MSLYSYYAQKISIYSTDAKNLREKLFMWCYFSIILLCYLFIF